MLDRLHVRLVRSRGLQRFTAVTRVALAVGFLPPGLKKVMGIPFTTLPTSTTVGYFFDAFFQAQAFYVFVGVGQVAAAVLLLWPRTATLGAVFYFPIILTITAITISVGFTGTWVITILMTLACLWLLVWDYDRLRAILPRREPRNRTFPRWEYVLQVGVWGGGGLVVGTVVGVFGTVSALPAVAGFSAVGAAFGALVAWHLRHLPPPPEAARRERRYG